MKNEPALSMVRLSLLAMAILDLDPDPDHNDVHQVLLQEAGNVTAAAMRLGVASLKRALKLLIQPV